MSRFLIFVVGREPLSRERPRCVVERAREKYGISERHACRLALQRETVRKQMEMAVPWQQPPSEDDTPTADCPPIADIELTPLIETAASQHQAVHLGQIHLMQSSVMHRHMLITAEYRGEPMFVALANPRRDTRHFQLS